MWRYASSESPIGHRPRAPPRAGSKAVPTTVTAPARRHAARRSVRRAHSLGSHQIAEKSATSLSKKSRSRSSGASANASDTPAAAMRSEEHTSELQSRLHLVCRLLLEKKKKKKQYIKSNCRDIKTSSN